ncbi:MAG: biotin transporter BioY [Chloroflexota bacterium]
MTIATPRMARVPAAERGITTGDFLVPIRVGERISARVRHAILVVLGALFIAATAYIAIPIPGTPVPVTAQAFGVLAVGGALGLRRGVMAALLYLLIGAVGLPVYAQHAAGLDTFASIEGGRIALAPTGGYLVGFVVAAGLVGRLSELGWDRSVRGSLAAFALGTLVIYLVGVPWLAVSLGVSAREAVDLGLAPFLVGAAITLVVVAGIFPVAWWVIGKRATDR